MWQLPPGTSDAAGALVRLPSRQDDGRVRRALCKVVERVVGRQCSCPVVVRLSHATYVVVPTSSRSKKRDELGNVGAKERNSMAKKKQALEKAMGPSHWNMQVPSWRISKSKRRPQRMAKLRGGQRQWEDPYHAWEGNGSAKQSVPEWRNTRNKVCAIWNVRESWPRAPLVAHEIQYPQSRERLVRPVEPWIGTLFPASTYLASQ